MHTIELKHESASLATQDIEVELIPLGSRSELGSREFREWVEIQSIQNQIRAIEQAHK